MVRVLPSSLPVDFHQNYFELFGLPVHFDLNGVVLTERYRDLQKVLHPDRFANASSQERRLSLQQAAHVNTGYETLGDPLARARYMLRLQGVEYDDESSTISDLVFLEEQMELREELVEIRHDKDSATLLHDFMAKLELKNRDYIEVLRGLFLPSEALDVAGVKNVVQRMQFVRRLQAEAEALEEELM